MQIRYYRNISYYVETVGLLNIFMEHLTTFVLHLSLILSIAPV